MKPSDTKIPPFYGTKRLLYTQGFYVNIKVMGNILDLVRLAKEKDASDLHLVRITDDTKTLIVEGLVDNEKAIFGYARGLRASGRFAKVVITKMAKEEGLGFTLTLVK